MMIVIDKIHPTTVCGIEPTKELGASLGELRYDLLLEVLQGLHIELLRQRDGDSGRGRIRLAATLNDTADNLARTMSSLEKTVLICRPYIEEEKRRS
ncbi:MAG: hypothetical protein ACYCZ7_00950 [Minisyncoccota bacterium]